MFDTADEILRRLRAVEDGRVEFKDLRFGKCGVVSPNTEDFAAELVAVAKGRRWHTLSGRRPRRLGRPAHRETGGWSSGG